MIRHASLVATRMAGRWRGALIEGPSGTGKSDLTIRMMVSGFRLVADDRVIVWTSGGKLFGRAPEPLSGLLEARGVGIIPAAPLDFCQVSLLVNAHGLFGQGFEVQNFHRLFFFLTTARRPGPRPAHGARSG